MADALGQPSVIVEFVQTHTPLDPRAGPLAFVQVHAEELRQNQPPPMPACSVQHVVPHAHDPVGGAWGQAS